MIFKLDFTSFSNTVSLSGRDINDFRVIKVFTCRDLRERKKKE